MDYDALAKQYGGAVQAPVVDYDTLAKQFGGGVMPVPTPAPAPQQPGFLTQLGRSAASLADVTVGGVLPAVVQQVGYPLARLGRSPEQAQAATARLVNAVESPVGKAFGITETPEYQQEAGRQVLDFIGQNFQKGAKWIAGKTGLPQSDIENYLGTATLAAPKAAPTVARAIRDVAAPQIEKAVIGAKMPFEARAQAKRERLSQEDYARGPQIDALADARRLKFLVNPVDIQSSVGTRLLTTAAGEKGAQNITRANNNHARNIALEEMELPPTTQLNGGAAFNQARAQVAAPYEQVKKLPIQQADDAMVQRLESIRTDLDVIGAKEYAPAISKIVDDAIAKTQTGLTGEQLLKNISVLRQRARKTYNNKSATAEALDIADTNLKVATELESMIDNSITNPKLLDEFRDARQKMARSYAYEGATDFNTGVLDVNKLARITAKDNNLTGNIAAIGRIAGNFPEVFTNKVATPFSRALSIGRSGAAGTFGGVAGYALGQDYVSAAAGTVLGALGGKIGESVAARVAASPSYQAGLNLRDARIPVNQLATATTQQAPQNALIPVAPEVFDAGGQPATRLRIIDYDVNGNPIYAPARGQRAPGSPDFTRQSEPTFGNRPTVFESQRGLPNEVPRQVYDAQKRAEMAQEFRARDERQPARGGTAFDLDPITGKLVPVDSTLRRATPDIQIIESTGKSLQGAADILTSGKSPALMSAEQRIAWNKTKVDLAEVEPGFKTLSDKALAGKMQDRAWVQDAIAKAQQKAKAFDDIAARANTERLRQDALMKREQMLDLVEGLEEQFRKARPTSTGGQGPKTREFQRKKLNMLSDQDVVNELLNR